MKAKILQIGVVDRNGNVHNVVLSDGVNIITGRSSTGKSALIEIFDYCFGSSDFTVPVGIITDCAAIYYTIIIVGKSALVLARRPNDSNAFIKEELDTKKFKDSYIICPAYFEEEYFRPLADFLKILKRHFGVVITDVDEDEILKESRGKKSSSPSVRSFTSYILQHQNLVANKHAIFYRFDEKEKREQAIDHLKIFLGFVDQHYYILSQELNDLKYKQRQIERTIPRIADARALAKTKLLDALHAYESISGKALNIKLEHAITEPGLTRRLLREAKTDVVADSDAHVRLKREAQDDERKLVARLRLKQQELAAINSSIEFSKKYEKNSRETIIPESAELYASSCPFCLSQNDSIEEHANELTEAINWLNLELSRSSYRLDSFEEKRKKVLDEEKAIRIELKSCRDRIKVIDQQINDLENVRNQYELAVEARIHIENILLELSDKQSGKLDDELLKINSRISEIQKYMKYHYNVDEKLRKAENRIVELLADIGRHFDFEQSYTPIHLHFSLATFDLWHKTKEGKDVFLRAMGSGANWLSCHLVLFLSLQRYFCELGDSCLIPTFVFFDQPSQVYFPSILDGGTRFLPEEIAKHDSRRINTRTVDEDVKAVTNLYAQLVCHCENTKINTGVMPQIIVTDHADNLDLPGDVTFESLVRKRWRKEGEGLIDLKKWQAK